MSDLFEEIVRDMQSDRMGDVWKKHGRWVIYTAISIVVVTAAIVTWKHYTHESAMRQTALYFEATDLLDKGDAAGALRVFEQISVPAKSSYYGLVLLKKAEAQRAAGSDEEAKKTLELLAERKDIYGDIGKILLSSAGEDSKKPTPLQLTRSEWAAWELVGKGNHMKAAEQFAALADDDHAPESLRARAKMMANYFKNYAGAKP